MRFTSFTQPKFRDVGLTICAIFLSSLGARAFQNWFESAFSSNTFDLLMNLSMPFAFISAMAAIYWHQRDKVMTFIFLAFMISLTVILFWVTEHAEEQMHYLFFGLLGVLSGKHYPKLIAVMICAAISIVDEWIQLYLPYRVGDPKDVMMNMVGASLGLFFIWFYQAYHRRKYA